MGDLNLDGAIDIDYVTVLSQYLCDLTNFNSIQIYLSDVDNNGYVDILDVTAIQRMLP